MLTTRGVYDGKEIKPSEETPFKESLESGAAPIRALRGRQRNKSYRRTAEIKERGSGA